MARQRRRPSSSAPTSRKHRSSSSAAWLREHFDDQYVKRAQREGYRSRAAYKLLELQEKDALIRPGMTVVDLGAAPGGWSQVAAGLVGSRGRVVASDILPMDALADVEFVLGDFTDAVVLQQILQCLDVAAGSAQRAVDLVISDMAPNMSGIRSIDQPRAMYLVELAFDLACDILKPDGDFVCKVFHGEGFDDFFRHVRHRFARAMTRKPGASRSRSREVYLVARGFRG